MFQDDRADAVIARLREREISQMLICDPLAIFYLTEKHLKSKDRIIFLYLSEEKNILFINHLQELNEDIGIPLVRLEGDDFVTISHYVNQEKALGIDKNLPVRYLFQMQDIHWASEYKITSDAVDEVRRVKSLTEQDKMIRSSALNDKAMDEFRKLIHAGVTEIEVSSKLPQIYEKLGADCIQFGIVAFGANAANPHHRADNTVLNEGDCVLFDVGALLDGYCSDMTRTFFYCAPSEHARKVYEIVRYAQETAEAAIRPGMLGGEIDKIARNIITEAGYGANFTHNLGHSIGLQCHEPGNLAPNSEIVLQPGMIFSVEPGIYIEGEIGVRIEDLVLVTEEGYQVLNSYTKDLTVIND